MSKYPKEELINYDLLNKLVNEWDSFIQKYDLKLDDEKLLLDILVDRRLVKYQDLRSKDMINKMPLGGLFKKLTKTATGKEDDDI